ncbi:MAG: hypothetical protein AAF211_34355, partial [Myxococcota bacterium]
MSFATTRSRRPDQPGGVARIAPDGTLDFRIDGFVFPHDILRDPADDSLLVVETGAGALHWIDGDGRSGASLRAITRADDRFPDEPNGAERVIHQGRTYVVLSHRSDEGRITLWDITDPEEARFVWRFPASGGLGLPHAPILRNVDDTWWLVWAHTRGTADETGTVGLATTPEPTEPPTYVAD